MKTQCMDYDAADMLSMLIDMATEPRSDLAVEIAKSKMRKHH